MTEWYEDDAFWHDVAPAVFSGERLASARDDVEKIMRLLELPAGASVLDLGCGVGRHAIEFARLGCEVTGVDRTGEYVAQAAYRAAEEGLESEWIEEDMREFRSDGAFDVVVSLLTSFGYFRDEADDRRVLDNVFASLKPGGRFVLDLFGKEALARVFRPRDWHELPDGLLLLEDRKVAEDWTFVDIRWLLISGTERREYRYQLRLFSASELHVLLRGAGFTKIKAYGSLSGTPYDHNAERLVMVASKPG